VNDIYTTAQNPDAGGVARQNTTPSPSQSSTLLHAFVLGPDLLPLSPQSGLWMRLPLVKPMDATKGFDPPQASPAPPSTQKASVDFDAAGARRAPGRDTTKRIPPFK